MKKNIQKLLLIAGLAATFNAWSGNPDRAGGAGGTQLLLNPYARSAGMMGANMASLKGAEALHFNVGGLAYTQGTELLASTAIYLQGTDIFMDNFSIGQQLGSSDNVLGLSFTQMRFGDIPIVTESQPDGTLGTYTPQVLNIGFSYARRFSNSINAGILLRYITEGVSNVSTSGLAVDAGVQYQTALNPKNKLKKEDFRFGIGVRNIGANMRYGGSGLSFRAVHPTTGASRKAYMGAESFDLPALVNIGVSYDIRLDKNPDTYFHRLTPSGNFNYNAYSNNVTSFGLEYAFKESFMVRGGYGWQEDILNSDYRTQYYGMSGGCTIQMPITASGTLLAIDYSYAPTRVFNGVHNITLRLNILNKKS